MFVVVAVGSIKYVSFIISTLQLWAYFTVLCYVVLDSKNPTIQFDNMPGYSC